MSADRLPFLFAVSRSPCPSSTRSQSSMSGAAEQASNVEAEVPKPDSPALLVP